ncbi:MAG: hypothetical protein JST00_35160 [Deltaproteobacteria bacterium]|nr:hypothetical protein [Deltaproteobacteria bacterium]
MSSGVVLVATAGLVTAACGDTAAIERRDDERDGSFRRDGGLVEPPDGGGGPSDAGAIPELPTCEGYCTLVTSTCTDASTQYRSREECLSVCALLPLGTGEEKGEGTVGCRQLYAGGPAKSDSVAYCAAAGPFGGNLCGDRCSAFCQIAAAVCGPDSGKSSGYGTFAECQTTCAQLVYTDAGDDGLEGPASGDTLNCRLYQLRQAIADPAACAQLADDGGACR